MDTLKRLDEAFRLISSIPVSGDNVEVMAAAKSNLRSVYAELKKSASVSLMDTGESEEAT